VVERIQRHATPAERHLLLLPVHAGDPERATREQRGGEAAERGNHAGLDELQLAIEVGSPRGHLVGQRIAVPRRPALEHGREVDVVELEADPGEETLQQVPRTSRERRPLPILVEARRLADERERRVRVALAEDHLRAPGVELTTGAAARLRGHLVQLRWARRAHRGHCTARPGGPGLRRARCLRACSYAPRHRQVPVGRRSDG
jgi:hypothetical protein